MSAIDTALEYRDAIEGLFLEQARWHDVEAAPSAQREDRRHEQSAEALRKAAVLLHAWSPDETDLQYFARFADVLARKGLDPAPEIVLHDSAASACRFFFDRGVSVVGDQEVVRLVEDLFVETVEQYDEAGLLVPVACA